MFDWALVIIIILILTFEMFRVKKIDLNINYICDKCENKDTESEENDFEISDEKKNN